MIVLLLGRTLSSLGMTWVLRDMWALRMTWVIRDTWALGMTWFFEMTKPGNFLPKHQYDPSLAAECSYT
jgi:hypothetical protein